MTDDLNQIEDEFSDSSGIDLRNKLQDTHGTHPYNWFQWLFNHLHPMPGQRILDLGCGTGDFWFENEPRLWEDWFIVLGDRSPAMLQQAARKISSTPYYFSYCLLDAQQVALAPASFDTVLAVGLFDILPEPERAFAEVHRLLRSGGRLYATGGSFRHLEEFEDLLQTVLPTVRLGGMPERFGLENGVQRLSPWFDNFQVHRYADRLVFEQLQPVLDYLLSEDSIASELHGERLADLTQRLTNRLQQRPLEVMREKSIIVGERRPDAL
jgi:ubiquinone/menaquinone biosynthesis C-methylase UbiE